MSEAKAHAKFVRIAPRKAQLVADLIRGKQVGEAIAIFVTRLNRFLRSWKSC